ncbi:MAG: putative peptide modification system cyclase [Rhodanobacteraceae bacterium]|nr:MAG: putative peptide modification system cyclase [Rhodanobacteraceae bacterium]
MVGVVQRSRLRAVPREGFRRRRRARDELRSRAQARSYCKNQPAGCRSRPAGDRSPMTAEIRQLETTPGPGRMATPQLRTLVVCDIADSTALVERMGDQNAANIIRKHDRLARALIEQHKGREIDKTDGFLLLFDRPVQAAAFALDYQRGLKHMSAAEGVVVRARVGIHMGDVVIWENAPEDVARGAKPIEVEGLVKPVAARLAQLARPQQILMSSAAAAIAHRAEGELGVKAAERVHWKDHGRYTFKGLPEALEVVEVGEDDVAPLHAPKSGRTAKKILPWWRRPLTLAAEAAVLAIGVGVGLWFLLQSPPTLAFTARDWVVVGNVHNLTGDRVFDQSVDSALRISLEQSQYVNVLPELSVQQTLQRMELNPDKTDVNRAIGSQVALRDGARALILPTVADVGGRVRVTAEVVDPNTQATVYSVSADGYGAQSVLPSLDSVSKQLRGKLGEALAMVSKQSLPLAQVATPDLNALRAYSLGERFYNRADLKNAESYFKAALLIDPHFALSRVYLAAIYEGEDRPRKAQQEILAAQADHNRLSARDALYVDAWASSYSMPGKSLAKWRLLATVYPDYFPGLANGAYFMWTYGNQFRAAIPYLERSVSPKNPHRATSEYLLGALYVEAGRYTDALRVFSKSVSDGAHFQNDYYASAYAAQHKFTSARTILDRGKASGITDFDLKDASTPVAMAVDQGDWQKAEKLLKSAQSRAKLAGFRVLSRYEIMGLSLRALDGTSANQQISELTNYLGLEEKVLSNTSQIGRQELKFQIALIAYLAAHAGDVKLATDALNLVRARSGEDTPVLDNMQGVAKAEIELMAGHPLDAIATLRALINGSELFITHVALMDAEDGAGDYAGALAEAHWLSSHRGRAYMESNSNQILAPFNIAESNLALSRAKNFSSDLHGVPPREGRSGAFM